MKNEKGILIFMIALILCAFLPNIGKSQVTKLEYIEKGDSICKVMVTKTPEGLKNTAEYPCVKDSVFLIQEEQYYNSIAAKRDTFVAIINSYLPQVQFFDSYLKEARKQFPKLIRKE